MPPATVPSATAAIHLELKSVNSRFLDVVFRAGDELRFLEMPLREQLAARIQRGKLECRLHLVPHQAGAPRELTLDAALVEQLGRLEAGRAQRAARCGAAVGGRGAALAGHARRRDASIRRRCRPNAWRWPAAVIDEFIASRAREGAKLATTILDRVARMRELVGRVGPMLPQALADYEQRLAAKLREAVASLDEERIRQEIGVFAAASTSPRNWRACRPISTKCSASSTRAARSASGSIS